MGLVPFKMEHLNNMTLKEDAEEIMRFEGMTRAMEHIESTGNGKTLLTKDGKTILGVLGFIPIMPGVCEVFIVATKDQKRHPIQFAKTVRKELENLKDKFRRVQAIATNDRFHARWLSWLGFTSEGILRKYGFEGEDLVMWGIV